MYVKKADLTEHLEKECEYRLAKCGFCKRQINLNRIKVPDFCCLLSMTLVLNSRRSAHIFFSLSIRILSHALQLLRSVLFSAAS